MASVALLAFAAVVGCSGGSGSPVQGIVTGHTVATPTPTSTKTPTPTATPTTAASATPTPVPSGPVTAGCTNTVSQSVAAGGTATLTTSATNGTFAETIAAGQITTATTATLGYQAQGNLAAPLFRSTHRSADGRRVPMFTAGAGNTYIIAFCAGFGGATPTSGVSLAGTGVVPSTIAAGTALNIAILQGGTWVDVGTAVVNATGNFQSTVPTASLPGINQTGTYLVYLPATGTNNTQVNFGFALAGDDGTASITSGLQFIQIEDTSGNAIPTPTTTFFPIANSGDLDGQSLTPDASRGAVVDGSSTLYFFSGIPQHTFTLAQPLDVSSFGTDGDSIGSLPGGDQVVVSVDNDTSLLVISGILAGSPVVADTIPDPEPRDGLVVSNDGKVMLARGYDGLDVFQIAPTAAKKGSTGNGTTSFSFSLIKNFPSSASVIAGITGEDGRDGMAISPADSSRGIVVGTDPISQNPSVQLLTGLTGSAPTVASLPLSLPRTSHRVPAHFQRPEPSAHRRPFALAPSGTGSLYAVSITPDGTTAYVSSDSGIVTVSGVNTGTLAQVGTVYAPTITANGNSCPIGGAGSSYSIGILPDGKYLVVDYQCSALEFPTGTTDTTQSYGIELTIPIGAGHVLGAPVGQLNQVVVPTNDQILVH